MKRLLLTVFALVSVVFTAGAQMMPQPLPVDPKIKTGKLDNGLTYYVAKNSEPKGQAEFYIAQKVGAILEEENQRGLAHFLEHMAFNGTKNFPGNSIITYLGGIGVKFGENLNAGTGIDQTVYNISAVPLTRPGIVDSCLLILHDWACAINLNEEDIDKERGVIREELRTRANAQMRMIETILPEVFPGSQYANRLPGGLVKVIDSFTYDELRAYYQKWYRPDLQGIIVIGDFDPAVVEEKIKSMFGSIPKPVNPAPRPEFSVPDTKDILVSVASDPEATSTTIILSFKNDVLPANLKNTIAYTVSDYMNDLIVNMTKARLSEIALKADAPFASASASYGDYIVAPTKAAYEFDAQAKEGEIEKAIKAIVNESERVRKYGFTSSELERAKASYMSKLEQQFKEKEKQQNEYYVNEALDNFINGIATPGVEMLYNLIQQFQGVITIDQLNGYAKTLPKQENLSLIIMMPQKEGLKVPSKEEVTEYYKSALMDNVEPYKETVSNEPLVSNLPSPGKITATTVEPISKATIWTLSNGATVYIKQTDFKEDQIMMSALSRGGFSQFDKSEIANTKVITNLLSIGGLGAFNATDLKKVLAGKNVSVNADISINKESLSGNASPKDIESLLQLMYLNFTSIRTDDEAYKSFKSRMENQLKSISADPMTAFSDTLQKALYGDSPYAKRITPEWLEKVDYHKSLELVKSRFANAADFAFVFVGNVDTLVLKPLVEKYIASLPAVKGSKENWKDVGMNLQKGQRINRFEKEMQTPKATVYTIYSGSIKNVLENKMMADMMSQVLDLVFTRTLREEEQGTYGVGVSVNIMYYPQESFLFYFGFDTDVALQEKLLARAYIEIEKVKKDGVDPKDFAKVIEFMTKNRAEKLRDNSYWMGVISSKIIQNKDFHSTYDDVLKSVTPEKLQKFIIETLNKADKAEVIMIGKAKEVK